MDNSKESVELEKTLAECRCVEEMQKTEGWQIIKRHLSDMLGVLNKKILYCSDTTETVRLQERYKAFSSVLEAASDYKKLLGYCEQELQKIEDHENYLESYGLN